MKQFMTTLRLGIAAAWAVLALVLGVGCRDSGSGQAATASSGEGGQIRVAATTTMVADLVRQVGGDRVAVDGLMGPGVDPHLYKSSARDVTKLQQADVIFYSGLFLEGKMEEVFAKMVQGGKRVHAVTDALPKDLLLRPSGPHGHPDPHVWFDVTLWSRCVEVVVRGLGEVRPADQDYFRQRGELVRKELGDLHQWALQRTGELPKERRVLVTSHDAFGYFGRAYGFQVVGLQGVSTVTESSLADMAKMVEFIRQHGVRAIFIESSVPPTTIRRISEDAGVKVGGELFSDAMGTPGQMEYGADLGTYQGMIKHNVEAIVKALK